MFYHGRVNVFPRPCNSSYPAINSLFSTAKLPVWYGVSPCSPATVLQLPSRHKKNPHRSKEGMVGIMVLFLLPLDGCGWLGRDVVADAVDATYLVDNLVGDLGQEVVRQMCPVGSHGIS